VEIVLTSQPGDKQRLLIALETFVQEHHLPAAVRQAADLALEEHLTNITRYAYEDARPHEVVVRFELEEGCAVIEVEDDGKPFNPLQMPEVDTAVPLDSKPVGGLGIHLIRQFMDDVQYRREKDLNILTMRKRLGAPPEL
jgi:anti-sigma regulatory factor (Ser/Thr protein kinase)